MKPGIHYHIRWSSDSPLDWKPFRTQEEATKAAEGIKKPNENYKILERDEDCKRCKEFKLKAIGVNNTQSHKLALFFRQ
jgi:hypothetical protein